MTTDEPKTMDTQALSLDAIRNWLMQTTQLFAKFALILVLLGGALFVSVRASLPLYVSYSLILIIAAVLFIMLIMVSINNIIYLTLKTSIWGQIVLYLLVALFSARSYLWAITEINRIFLVDPSNMTITTTVLTAAQFFRYAIIVLLASYLFAIGLYLFLRRTDTGSANALQQTSYDHRALNKTLGAGALFVIVVVLSMITASKLSKYNEVLIQAFATNIDFYSHYTCSGEDFEDIDGVLFLSASDILTAKQISPTQWQFNQVKCEP